MPTITINTRMSAAVQEWLMKEEGSFDDHNRDKSHVYAILSRFKGKVTLTLEEAETVLTSGRYHRDGWLDDEICGGAATKKQIGAYVKKIEDALTRYYGGTVIHTLPVLVKL